MAFLQVKSTNPQFSYLIKKNPASGLVAKDLRKGTLFGYYSDESGQTYNVYFRDAFNDISYPEFKDQEFEYVNATRYSSAQFVLNALAELLRDAFKKRDLEKDPDDQYENSIMLNMIRADNTRTIKAFLQHFMETSDFSVEEVTYKYNRITITTKKSLYYLLNLTNLFAVFTVIRNKSEYLYVEETTVEKYFTALAAIDPPYFIRYHFKIELLRSLKLFNQYKPLLETSSRYPLTIYRGDTLEMRQTAVEKELSFSNHIVDVGCGEGRYVFAFAQRLLKGKQYYAVDVNEECRNAVARKVRLRELTNICVLDSLETVLAKVSSNEKIDFILGEVIEHMSLDEAEKLITRCLSLSYMNSVIVTTPNADFNKFYFDDSEKMLRHPDHQFEFTKHDFQEWIRKIWQSLIPFVILPNNYTVDSLDVKFMDIGDVVDGIPVTLGAVFSRRTK